MAEVKLLKGTDMMIQYITAESASVHTPGWLVKAKLENFPLEVEISIFGQKTPDANGFFKNGAKYKVTIEKIE